MISAISKIILGCLWYIRLPCFLRLYDMLYTYMPMYLIE